MHESRRNFLKNAGGVAAAGAFASAVSSIGAPMTMAATQEDGMEQVTKPQVGGHILPPLPYDYDALEPHIDEETMRIHHDRHHQGYVNGLNTAEKKLAEARDEGDYELVQYWTNKAAFNGGGHYLHSMFWKAMAPPDGDGGGEPSGTIAELIKRDFGDFGSFKEQFSAAAKTVEGSGWGLLHYRFIDGKLLIRQAENQHKLSSWGTIPILGIDVWEHAYYIKYRNRRGEYIENWWNVVNWPMVDKNVELVSGLHEKLAGKHR